MHFDMLLVTAALIVFILVTAVLVTAVLVTTALTIVTAAPAGELLVTALGAKFVGELVGEPVAAEPGTEYVGAAFGTE